MFSIPASLEQYARLLFALLFWFSRRDVSSWLQLDDLTTLHMTFHLMSFTEIQIQMGQMDRSGTEDLGLVARLMYGYILSNTRVLSPSDSSFVLLAGLIPQDVIAVDNSQRTFRLMRS